MQRKDSEDDDDYDDDERRYKIEEYVNMKERGSINREGLPGI
jgi:hypothetical protein